MPGRKTSFFFSLFFIGAIGLFGQDEKSYLISPPVDNIFDFYLSESDKVYFGNSENLWIYDLIQDSLINHYDLNLSSEITAVIACEERNEVFLGTKNGSVGRFDYLNENMTHYVNHPGDRITTLAFDAEHNFLKYFKL
jgi:hypothetical protein